MFVRKVIDALTGADVPYTLVGGYALVLHGVIRGTVDIDIANRNLRACSFYNPANPLEVVDILITEDAETISSIEKSAFGMTLHVAAIDALIAMKRKAGRPQDIEDIKALEKLL